MTRRFSAYVMGIFMKKTILFRMALFYSFIHIGNTNNDYHLSKSENLFCRRKLTARVNAKCKSCWCISWRFWAQIGHVYLIKFTQAFLLSSNWWIGVKETNYIQRVGSTDVNASNIFYSGNPKKILKKREFIKPRNNLRFSQRFLFSKNLT